MIVSEYNLTELIGWPDAKLLANERTAYEEYQSQEGTELEYETWLFWNGLAVECDRRGLKSVPNQSPKSL